MLKYSKTQQVAAAKTGDKVDEVIGIGKGFKSKISWLDKGDDTYGWTKIWKKQVTGEIPGDSTFTEAYGVSDETTIQKWILNSIKDGAPFKDSEGNINRIAYQYYPVSGNSTPVITIVDYGPWGGATAQAVTRLAKKYPLSWVDDVAAKTAKEKGLELETRDE